MSKKGKAKPNCFVCGNEMKKVVKTEIVCPKCGSKLQEPRALIKKGKAKPRKERVPRCPECKSEDVAVLCFGDEPTQMVCNNCEHEWKPRGG